MWGRSLSEQLQYLIELQKGDLAAARIIGKKRELPEKLQRLNGEFEKLTALMEDERRKLEDLHRSCREKESKLKSAQELVKKAKNRLNEVKTNKEYQAILKEIETIEKKTSDTEDEILACLDEIDHVDRSLKTREIAFEEDRQRYEREKGMLEEEIGNLDAELAAVQETIREARKRIHEDVLKRYLTIKGLRNGLAVVSAWKEVCNVTCGLVIPRIAASEEEVYDVSVPSVRTGGQAPAWGPFISQNGSHVVNVEGFATAVRLAIDS